MKDANRLLVIALFMSLCLGDAFAQTGKILPPPVPSKGTGPHTIYPAAPTSADTINVTLSRYKLCPGVGGLFTVLLAPGNLYRVSMAQNVITVTLRNNSSEYAYPAISCSPASPDVVEIGRLPAGNYILNVVEPPSTVAPETPTKLVDGYAFTVSDARAAKVEPWVRVDYSGHWWDPADSGWGLFIWQDAKSPTDSILAAWFTYAPDGKSQWYVFQPTWLNTVVTTTAPLLFTARFPGPTSPPPGNTANIQPFITVGTASLDFNETGATGLGKITYKFGDGPTLVRTIRRFMP